MSDLSFFVEGAEAVEYAAVPQLALRLRLEQAEPRREIQTIALQCQVRIEPSQRRYDPSSHAALSDLFGEPERWSKTVRSMLWLHTSAIVPSFSDKVSVKLPLPCSFDFNVAATKYFYGLDDGDVPLCLLFSGTIFYQAEDGNLQVAQIPWEKEASYRLPVEVWRSMMDHYYPHSAWLQLDRDAFEKLADYKRRHSIPTWDRAIERLLAVETSPVALP
jgi:Family of unknown function (DUF6084)